MIKLSNLSWGTLKYLDDNIQQKNTEIVQQCSSLTDFVYFIFDSQQIMIIIDPCSSHDLCKLF